MKALVVFYSRSGTTRAVAESIARNLGADLEEIHDPTDRRGVRGYVRSILDATLRRPAPIDKPLRDAALYDLVVLGTPVWNASLSAPVRSYLQANGGKLSKVAFFVTEGGRGERRVFGQMAAASHRLPIATLALAQRDVVRGRAGKAIGSFASTLRQLVGEPDGAGRADEIAARMSGA